MASERDLAAQGDLLEFLTDLDGAGRVEPVHVDMAELRQEPQVIIRVPAEGERIDLLPASSCDGDGYSGGGFSVYGSISGVSSSALVGASTRPLSSLGANAGSA